jgi:hypothetical protein
MCYMKHYQHGIHILCINDTWKKPTYFNILTSFKFKDYRRGLINLMNFMNLLCFVVLKLLSRLSKRRNTYGTERLHFVCLLWGFTFIRKARQIAKRVGYVAYPTATETHIRKSVYISHFETSLLVRYSYMCTVK